MGDKSKSVKVHIFVAKYESYVFLAILKIWASVLAKHIQLNRVVVRDNFSQPKYVIYIVIIPAGLYVPFEYSHSVFPMPSEFFPIVVLFKPVSLKF